MTTPADASDTARLVTTRPGLQALAEHVLGAARHAATGRIGLRPTATGMITPPFPSPHGDRTVATDGIALVVTDDRGIRRAEIRTLREAATFAEVEPGAPTEVFTPTTPLDLDAPNDLDAGAVDQIAGWWMLVDAAFTAFAAEHPDDEGAPAQLWPEHFDLGGQVGEVNYGGSPGDEGDPLPYLYVGPWSPPSVDGFWNRPYGIAVPATEVPDVDAAVAVFREARSRLDASAG